MNMQIDFKRHNKTQFLSPEQIQEFGANLSDFKVAYVLAQADYYYAFNRETPDSLVQSFQEALDYLKNNTDRDGLSDYGKILYKIY